MIFLHPPQSCRYNDSGFVEELHHLPENRWGHACAALRGVRPVQSFPVTRVSLLPPASFCVYDSVSTKQWYDPYLNLQALVVAGGRDGEGSYLSSVLTLLPDATAWTPLAFLPRGLWGARASIVGGRLRVNGGQDGPGSYRYEVMIEK